MSYDVHIYGPVFCDIIFTGLTEMPTLGRETFAQELTVAAGGSAIVAAGLHRLGAKVGLIADLGNDPLSTLTLNHLEELGLDLSLIQRHPYPLARVSVALSYPHDRAFITRFQQSGVHPNLSAILAQYPARHVHICSILGALDIPEICQTVHAAGATISMDPGWDDQLLHDTRLSALVADLDFFLPSQVEISEMAPSKDLDHSAWQVLSQMKHGAVIVKMGAEGASAYLPDADRPVHVAAIPVKAVDTTGAGDAFDAGFLYAYLNNLPVETCLRYGVICGGLATTAQGGTSAIPNKEELGQWLSRSPL